MEVVIVGTVAFDDLKTPFGEREKALGGSATFASLACSLFSKASIVSIVGEDFPKQHLDFLESKGVDTKGIVVKKGSKTFHWKGEYGSDLNSAKTLQTDLNVLLEFKPVLSEKQRESDFLFLGNIDPDLQLDVLSQMKKRPGLVVADTMNLWIGIKRDKVLEVIKKVDVVLMNDAEARQLFGTKSLVESMKKIIELDSKIAIIKQGEYGSVLFMDGKYFSCPGYPLEDIQDPTGAGDSFGGTLIGYLAKTKDFSEANIRKAIVYASAVASFNVEGFSVERLKEISLADVEARFNEFRDFVKF
ncbi:MAG: sugar kinase [Candidatus Diapherotrites archaeon CG11_big_fil_rev_8_21_14_0_20_37_9]|nr:MAG: sugar kinase [Candidatus Diapherotrites archaeon CG11_big_fil_rev_8_21_14_0_20_37_9]